MLNNCCICNKQCIVLGWDIQLACGGEFHREINASMFGDKCLPSFGGNFDGGISGNVGVGCLGCMFGAPCRMKVSMYSGYDLGYEIHTHTRS